MPVHFTCPHCQEQTLVDDQYIGHSGNCIQCGRPIVVPGVPSSQTAAPPPQRKRQLWPIFALVGLVGAGGAVAMFSLLAALLGPALEAARDNSLRNQCARNLRQIGAALIAYEADYGTLPPAFVADSAGLRLHSWRVLILPYLGAKEKELYSRYDFNLPWNSAQNMLLAREMPAIYACPADPQAQTNGETNYMVLAGSSTLFPGGNPLPRARAVDGLEQTILVMEVSNTGVGWLEPKDIVEGAVLYHVGIDIGGNHNRGANVLMANGEVELLPPTMPPEHVQALFTPAGHEPNPLDP